MKKSLLNLFFEISDEKDEKSKSSTKIPEVTQKEVTSQISPQIMYQQQEVASGYTGKFDSTLESIIEKENLPGPDVYELITSVKELQVSGLSEDQAYRSSFTAFKSMGLTKDKLIETANHYLSILSSVYSEFQTDIIGKKQDELTKLDEYRTQLMKEIESKTSELNELGIKRNSLNTEVISTKQEIDGSYNRMDSLFKGVILKIQNYL